MSETRIRLICGNCGKVGRFESWEEAFDEGWDTVARFGYNACDGCPGVSVYFPMMYAQEARNPALAPEKREELLAQAAEMTLAFEPGVGSRWEEFEMMMRQMAKERQQ